MLNVVLNVIFYWPVCIYSKMARTVVPESRACKIDSSLCRCRDLR